MVVVQGLSVEVISHCQKVAKNSHSLNSRYPMLVSMNFGVSYVNLALIAQANWLNRKHDATEQDKSEFFSLLLRT